MTIRNSREEQFHAPSIDELRKTAGRVLRSLRFRSSDDERAGTEFDNLRTLIESLPAATSNFGLAMNRLRSVQRYLSSDEIGAARYELRLLLGGL
jgi:hypothetical protein